MSQALIESVSAAARLQRAAEWLAARAPSEEVLMVGATADAANDLLRAAAQRRGASFGWHRATLPRLASILAAPELIAAAATPIPALAAEAVAARILHDLGGAGRLGRYARAAHGPGLARAVTRSLTELRQAGVQPDQLDDVAPDLRAIAAAFAAELERAGLADRAAVFALAARAARRADSVHPLLARPTLLVDVAVSCSAERELVAAIAARAPDVIATVPGGDDTSRRHLAAALACEAQVAAPATTGALAALQTHLFAESAPPAAAADTTLSIFSAPGESRECVEIARRLLQAAARGVPFDRMAVLLRSPEEYRPHLAEALQRADIPAHFARGAVQPHPAGRAFAALLACADEGLSARRFAEYLSLAQVPDDDTGMPPAPQPASDRWVTPDDEMVPAAVAAALRPEAPAVPSVDEVRSDQPESAAVRAGSLRAPRHWERLIVDAAVIGGRERWERRLEGLRNERRLDLAALDEGDERDAEWLQRDLAALDNLQSFALPLLGALEELPRSAAWGVWLDALGALATMALRRPQRVLAALAELQPMADVGPVDITEVRMVLEPRLLEVAVPPPDSRYGRVFVAPIEAARGLAFDVVFIPGLAERLFPRKIAEEPILLDDKRRTLGAAIDGASGSAETALRTNDDRVADERLALRLAAGAATTALVLSYPRLDLDQARPRVPSFYALEALRAAEGTLPSFVELAERAEQAAAARVGWPAPARPADAIDEAEHDLALLERLLGRDSEESVGTARYLLTVNPHLGRALRFRARRWLKRWTPADGLVQPSDAARAALHKHTFAARSFSPTALEKYAACPYRFLLHAVHRLSPREVPEAIEEMNPLQRGSLVHQVQFELFERLREETLLPVDAANLARARALLDTTLDRVAALKHEELAPAIERVWEAGIESIRADLREWLRRASEDTSGFVPWRFELSFGLRGRRDADTASVPEAVPLDGGLQLRGSIDLVERRADGALRATDHKTGSARVSPGATIAGGTALQPLLYAMALEKMFPDAAVDGGRLYYCTTAGGFEERPVPLDPPARRAVAAAMQTVGGALDDAFLPAAPDKGACRWCDYRVVCGPYEELRIRRKPQGELKTLKSLRGLP